MVNEICLGEVYCRCGVPMLKTRIQLPAVTGGQPADWMLSLAGLTQRYAEQTLVPAVCEAYDSLSSVAEKMHFEPWEYRHVWQAEPHPGISALLTVRIVTELRHGGRMVYCDECTVTIDGRDGRIVKGNKRTAG